MLPGNPGTENEVTWEGGEDDSVVLGVEPPLFVSICFSSIAAVTLCPRSTLITKPV